MQYCGVLLHVSIQNRHESIYVRNWGRKHRLYVFRLQATCLDPSWWFLVVWTLSLRWPIPNLSWHLVGKEFPAKYCSWKIFCFYLFVDWRGLIPKKESSPLLQGRPTAPELNIKSVYRCLHWLLQPPLPSISKDSYSLVSLGVGLESLDHHKKT